MSNIKLHFNNPLFLLILIPGILLSLYPYFRLNKQNRKTRNRITSMVIHIISLTLIVLVLAGFVITQEQVSIKNEVFLVIDYSSSNTGNKDLVDEKVKQIVDTIDVDYKLGMISFGNEPKLIASLSTNKEDVLNQYLNYNEAIETNGTNIEKALQFAYENFSEKNSGRIILITDGRETDGKAVKGAYDLASLGVKIDIIYLSSPQSRGEVQITNVTLPDHVERGIPINIMVSTESAEVGNATIKVYDNDELIGDGMGYNVLLNGGKDNLSFEHTFLKSGVHEIRVEIERHGDLILENNVFYTFTNVDGRSNRVLIIDGTGNESTQLNELILNDFQTEVIHVNELANNPDVIKAYDGIILMNVADSDLPLGFDAKLKYYVEFTGGGLLTVGGNKAYQQEDMAGSIFESILPVFANTDAKSMAVVLVIDKSGSMITHNSQKLELAKEGAINSVNALKDNDYVSIVIFDANPVVLVEPTPASRRDEIIEQIRTITAGQGTRYTGGLQLAKNQLDNFPGNQNFNKHVIFLTDGAPQDTGYEAVINQYGNISLSTIAIGDDHGINYQIVESMVRVVEGRGQYYQVIDEYELPGIMENEALSISSGFLNEGEFEPIIQTRIPSVATINQLPNLKGYYGARLKNEATLVLRKESDPIYAEWSYGNGKVGSFMSDLSGRWSSQFYEDEIGRTFIKNIIKGILPEDPINNYDLYAKFKKNNFETNVTVTAFLTENDYIVMDVIDPLGNKKRIDLVKQTSSTFSGVFETLTPGLYNVEITKLNQSGGILGKHVAYTTFSYSKEYEGFYSDHEVFNEMKNLAEIGNGDILFNLEGIFSKEAQRRQHVINPNLAFFIIALILFLIDIVTRKFKFKWPHEWFRDKSEVDLYSNKV